MQNAMVLVCIVNYLFEYHVVAKVNIRLDKKNAFFGLCINILIGAFGFANQMIKLYNVYPCTRRSNLSVTKKKYGPEPWKELPEDWLEGLNIKTQVSPLNHLK